MEKASQDKREKNASYQPEMHVRNANSREIFKNNRLTSQFLRNYTDIPLLANVMPEDIEEYRKNIRHFWGWNLSRIRSKRYISAKQMAQ